MNIVYGGAFNPPTIAHENAIKKVLEVLDVERFIVVPVGGNYHLKEVASNEHRFCMCKLMCDAIGVEISDVEMKSTEYKGTYDLLTKLNMKNTMFLIGSDNLKYIDKWITPEKILSEFGLVVLARRDDINLIIQSSELLMKYKENIVVIEDFEYEVSSTMFRETLNYELVSENIKQYIIDNELYGR